MLVVVGTAAAALVASLLGGVTTAAAGRPSVPPTTAALAALNPVTPLTAAAFAQPPQNDLPWVRWNWNPAITSTDELRAVIGRWSTWARRRALDIADELPV